MNARRLLPLLLAGTFCTTAQATDSPRPDNRYFAAMGSYLVTDRDWGPTVDDGAGVQFIFGKQYASRWGYEYELFGDFIETGPGNGTDYYRPGLGLNLTYSFGDRSHFTPFILAGVGGAYNDVEPDTRDSWDAYATAGIGAVSSMLGDSGMQVRSEIRYIHDTFEDGVGDVRFALGLEIPLYAPAIGRQGDSVRVVELTREIFSNTGLEDSDRDGVVDSSDRCPDTPRGTRVDGEGCPLARVVRLKGVNFETNSSRLRADSRTILNDVATVLNRYPDMTVEIAGHTDARGADSYNQRLSQRRADSVRSYLIEQGVVATRLSAKGYGETDPVADNGSREGRELNRRVELRIKD